MAEDFSSLAHVSPILTNETVTKALSDWFKEDVTFTHWEYVSGTGKGDSYLSELMRIRIYGKDENNKPKHVQVILKNIPQNVSRRLTFRSEEFFRNEINFYKIVLPGLLKFQASKNLKDPFINYVNVFFSYCDGINDVICLEDAVLENFGSAVRQEGIDLQHCKVTFKALAKYHAISFAMRDQQPKEFDKIRKVLFETYYHGRLWDWYQRFWKRICGIAIDAVEKEHPDSIYLEKIKKFAVPERYKSMIKVVEETYDTGAISHGDCWTNNFLYKYEDGRAVDAKLIDFQLARCATPILDLSFAVYACTSQDLRLKHYDDLLKYYYEVLSGQIKAMGSDPNVIYPWEKFLDEVKKYSQFGLAFSFESTPFIVLPPEEAIDMEIKGDDIMNIDDVWQLNPFKTREGRLREVNNIVHAVDHGFI